jgi:hypothetical protein
MATLFRYIQHDFAVGKANDPIEVANDSDFQTELRDDAAGDDPRQALRHRAGGYLDDTFPTPTTDPTSAGDTYLGFADGLAQLEDVNASSIGKLVKATFGEDAASVLATEAVGQDKTLLENSILAIKLATGFNRADADRLVRQLRVIALLEAISDGVPSWWTRPEVDAAMARPIRIEAALLPARRRADPPEVPPGDGADAHRVRRLRIERDMLDETYRSLMTTSPRQLEAVQGQALEVQRPAPRKARDAPAEEQAESDAVARAPGYVRLGEAAIRALPDAGRRFLADQGLAADEAPLEDLVAAVTRRRALVERDLLPSTLPASQQVYRVGNHLFAANAAPATAAMSGGRARLRGGGVPQDADLAMDIEPPADGGGGGVPMPLADPAPAAPEPDFSFAVTRPAGYGDLLIVRQELLGYEATEISHIENVLRSELLRRTTRREELVELSTIDEASSTQSQERDQQSTSRSEVATEAQKESGQSTTTSGELSSTSSYGKLVENSKSNYAQSVTSRAVDTVTNQVRQQRSRLERRAFVEEAVHELDNKDGDENIRGVYQWVDKKYRVRVLNYGRRLLYDVVVPEPASFLIDSLKATVKPEAFQLTKPGEPSIQPDELSAWNYRYWAALYGATGAVKPPPDDFVQTVATANVFQVDQTINAFGGTIDKAHFNAFKMRVPDGYDAVSGYVQRINPQPGGTLGERYLEFFIGEGAFLRFGPAGIGFLNETFTMSGETGDIPVTLRSFNPLLQEAYAVGINCRRTDTGLQAWQLETHAAIMAAYRRQLAEYEDKLGRYVAAVRTQVQTAGNYAHDPTIEQAELKKAFISLLLGEHPAAFLPTPEPAPVPPFATLPDPVAVRAWGAMVAFFERAFEWENVMYTFYPYFWGRVGHWAELILTQDTSPGFEAFLKAGAARVVVPARPGFEAALAHYHETGDIWLGEEIPDMFSDNYVSIIDEIKAANRDPGTETCVDSWDITVPTTLVMLRDDDSLPAWTVEDCTPPTP